MDRSDELENVQRSSYLWKVNIAVGQKQVFSVVSLM